MPHDIWPSESSVEQQVPSNRSSFSPESSPSDTRDVEGARDEPEFTNETEGFFVDSQELVSDQYRMEHEGDEFAPRAVPVTESKQQNSAEASVDESDDNSDGNGSSTSSDEDDKLGTVSFTTWNDCSYSSITYLLSSIREICRE